VASAAWLRPVSPRSTAVWAVAATSSDVVGHRLDGADARAQLVDAGREVDQDGAVLAGVVRIDRAVQTAVFEVVAGRRYLGEALGEPVGSRVEVGEDGPVLAGAVGVDVVVEPALSQRRTGGLYLREAPRELVGPAVETRHDIAVRPRVVGVDIAVERARLEVTADPVEVGEHPGQVLRHVGEGVDHAADLVVELAALEVGVELPVTDRDRRPGQLLQRRRDVAVEQQADTDRQDEGHDREREQLQLGRPGSAVGDSDLFLHVRLGRLFEGVGLRFHLGPLVAHRRQGLGGRRVVTGLPGLEELGPQALVLLVGRAEGVQLRRLLAADV